MFKLKHAPSLRKALISQFNCLAIFQKRYTFVLPLSVSLIDVQKQLFMILRILWERLPTYPTFRRFTRRFGSCWEDDGPIWWTSGKRTAGLFTLINTIINRKDKVVWALSSTRSEMKRTQIKIEKSVNQFRPPRYKCDTHFLVYGFPKICKIHHQILIKSWSQN